LTLTATTTAAALTLDSLVTSGSSSFLSSLGDLFQEYRFEDLMLTIYPPATGVVGSTIAVGYQNEITDASPTTVGQILAMPFNNLMTDTMTVPVKFKVPQKILRRNMQNYWRTQLPSQTNTGTGTLPTSNVWESIQGVFWFIASVAATSTAVLKYTLALVNPVAAALTPRPNRRRTEAILGWRPLDLTDPMVGNPQGEKDEHDSRTGAINTRNPMSFESFEMDCEVGRPANLRCASDLVKNSCCCQCGGNNSFSKGFG